MAFLESIVGVIAEKVVKAVIERFDSYLSKKDQFDASRTKRSKKNAKFKEEIEQAQSLEEYDAILDKFNDLFDDSFDV